MVNARIARYGLVEYNNAIAPTRSVHAIIKHIQGFSGVLLSLHCAYVLRLPEWAIHRSGHGAEADIELHGITVRKSDDHLAATSSLRIPLTTRSGMLLLAIETFLELVQGFFAYLGTCT